MDCDVLTALKRKNFDFKATPVCHVESNLFVNVDRKIVLKVRRQLVDESYVAMVDVGFMNIMLR